MSADSISSVPNTAPIEAAGPRLTRLGRQRHIVAVLSRHGFGLLVQRSPVPFPGRGRLAGGPESLLTALEELGPTFIKLGQVLSTRPDILPEDYIQALSALQDQLPPISTEEIRGMILRELGGPPEELFARFDPVPLATASIGQVHAAQLHSGEQVVVKVQKPGISHQIELDLMILRDLARLAADRVESPLFKNMEEVVEQFADTLRAELDYVREGRNAERFVRLMGSGSRARVPRMYWELTTSRVLTMERLYGAKVNDLEAIAVLGVDRRQLSRDLAGLVLRQVFELGFFHADPHPGNYFVQTDGKLGMMDFGMVGSLDESTRRDMLLLLAAWVKNDADGLAESLMALGVARGGTQITHLQADMRRVLARYYDVRLQEIKLTQVLNEIFRLARRHNLVLRGDLSLMGKTLAMHEGLGMVLDPQFHLVQEARPYVESAMRHLYIPQLDAKTIALNLRALFDLTANFPQRANRLLGRVERGDLGVTVRPEGLDPVMRDLNHMVNRLSLSILAASFIVGLALLLQVVENSHGSLLLLVLFATGLMASGVLGLWLLISMYRSGKSH